MLIFSQNKKPKKIATNYAVLNLFVLECTTPNYDIYTTQDLADIH
jgi:hypothetical protein